MGCKPIFFASAKKLADDEFPPPAETTLTRIIYKVRPTKYDPTKYEKAAMGFEPISDRSAGDCLTGFGYAADNERA